MLQPHGLDRLDEPDDLEPRETEDDRLQLDLLEYMVEVAMQLYHIPAAHKTRVELAIGMFWNTYFAQAFREKCCDGKYLRSDIYAKLDGLTNREKIETIMHIFEPEARTLADFIGRHYGKLKRVLLEQGFDLDVHQKFLH